MKRKIQRDWLIAFTLTITFLTLNLFGEIDWKWYWIISPIWLLASFYLLITSISMAIYKLTKR